MGQIGSSVSKIFRSQKDREYLNDPKRFCHNAITPYVFVRRGSMYYDEDGDLAHEFYEETKTSKGTKMKKKSREQLQPQGWIDLKIPRINRELGIVLHEV